MPLFPRMRAAMEAPMTIERSANVVIGLLIVVVVMTAITAITVARNAH